MTSILGDSNVKPSLLVVVDYPAGADAATTHDGTPSSHSANKPLTRQRLIDQHLQKTLVARGVAERLQNSALLSLGELGPRGLAVHTPDYLRFLAAAYQSWSVSAAATAPATAAAVAAAVSSAPAAAAARPAYDTHWSHEGDEQMALLPNHFSSHPSVLTRALAPSAPVGAAPAAAATAAAAQAVAPATEGEEMEAWLARLWKLLPLYKLSGVYCSDWMTPIYAWTSDAAFRSAMSSVLAAEAVMGARRSHRAAFALNSLPGHHAGAGHFAGYCFLNNSAIAARRLQQLGADRVCVLDVDYHSGNGTQEIFYQNGSVLTISIHADPATEFPSFSGFADELGAADGAGCNLNLPLPPNTAFETGYRAAMQIAFARLREFGPQALVVAFGGDTLHNDPDPSNIAGFALVTEDYGEMGRLIGELNLPTVVTQEGGYDLDLMPAVCENFLSGLIQVL